MFWQVKQHKENGEIITKTFSGGGSNWSTQDMISFASDGTAKIEAVSFFEDVVKEAEATQRILASDKTKMKCTKQQFQNLCNDAVTKVQLTNCLNILLATKIIHKNI